MFRENSLLKFHSFNGHPKRTPDIHMAMGIGGIITHAVTRLRATGISVANENIKNAEQSQEALKALLNQEQEQYGLKPCYQPHNTI